MTPNDVTVALKYSLDYSGSWQTAKSYAAVAHCCIIGDENQDKSAYSLVNDQISAIFEPRLALDLKLGIKQFLLKENKSASPNDPDSLYVYIQKLLRSPLIHANITTLADIDGFSQFYASNNTNYLYCPEPPDTEWQIVGGEPAPDLKFRLVTVKTIALT